jgi:hypothetical protein
MDDVLDLFGDPVPPGRGKRGRPAHIATRENRYKVSMLLSLGWSNERIAGALQITQPTLRKNYFQELRTRIVARDRLDARLAMLLWTQCEGGNVGAMREFQRLLDRNDVMSGHRSFYDGQRQPAAADDSDSKPEKIGKKELAARAAAEAGDNTAWGDDLKPRTH